MAVKDTQSAALSLFFAQVQTRGAAAPPGFPGWFFENLLRKTRRHPVSEKDTNRLKLAMSASLSMIIFNLCLEPCGLNSSHKQATTDRYMTIKGDPHAIHP
ncbi:MAG TPA: hypothetical protein PLR02_03560 [Rhodocyclaceae bacterium]|nr:hypothetical protein [Rhodocyclaceae bacterium]